ncbi:MAG: tetratricopeptide repeat protein [Chloroflexi bacterium]|nr:tetratricopeptide repeat protein [Chloroflexota bacterium]
MLKLYLLGAFRLERDSKRVNFSTRKIESLLAYLALFPEQHSREKLAALLWGDSTDEQARHSLRTALAAIRKALGDEILIADRESVQLNPDAAMWVDVRNIFDLRLPTLAPHASAGVVDSEIANLKSKIENYHDLLPDFYDEWIIRERERLRAIYLDALLQLAQHYRSTSEYARAIETAQKVLATDRANENAYQHLMFCFAAQGDRIAALKQYDECKKILREELNAEPSSETTALRDQIMAELTGAPSREASLTNLPTPLTSFVGREKEIKELKELLATTRLLTLIGAGGSGKTRLAIQVATDAVGGDDSARRIYKNGAWWVEFAALSDATLVPQAIAKVFGLQESAQQPLVETLTNYLRAKQMLLVLDNCEHLVAACAQLAQLLLTHCSNLKILATSQEVLGIAGEAVYRVPSLAVPDAKQLPPVEKQPEYDAIRFFVDRVRGVSRDFSLNEQNARVVTQICAQLDGIPLALELAAARLKTLSAEQVAARLDDRFQLLTGGSRTAMARQQTLRAMIDWSYDLLSEQERALLRRLSVFAGGWTLEAAESVCSGDGMEKRDVIDLLTKLLDKSLVAVEAQDELPRYRMLETIRQYARDKLLETGEGEAIRNHHLDYFLSFAEAAEPRLHGPEQVQWLDRLDIDHDNLRSALEWSLGEGRVEKGLRLAAALMWFWYMRAHWSEGRQRVESLLNQPEAAPKTLTRAKALLVLANEAGWLSAASTKIQYLEELIAIAREYGVAGKRTLALGLGFLGLGLLGDDPGVAESKLEEGLAIARSLDDDWVGALLLWARGWQFRGKKDDRAALNAFEESLSRFNSLGDEYWTAEVSLEITRIYFREGEFARARQEFEKRLPFLGETKNRRTVWSTLNGLGEIARAEGRYDLAKIYYRQGLEIARELGEKNASAIASVTVGYVALHDGDLNSARSLFVEGLALAREVDYQPLMAFALLGFAGLAAAEKQARRAVRLLAVVDPFLEAGDRRVVNPADAAEYKRHLAIAREQLDEAAFNVAWAEGKAMTLEQAIEYALENVKSIS